MTNAMTRITVEWLKRRGAMCNEVEVFAREWPEGAEVTEVNLTRAAELGLDLHWFACKFFTGEPLAEYWRQMLLPGGEFVRQIAPFRAEFLRREALLRAKCLGGGNRLFLKYRREEASLYAEFLCQEQPFWMEFQRQVALVIWRVWQELKP